MSWNKRRDELTASPAGHCGALERARQRRACRGVLALLARTMSLELEKRKRLGLNLPFTDVAAVVANRLGHESLSSQDAYIRSHGVAHILGWEDE